MNYSSRDEFAANKALEEGFDDIRFLSLDHKTLIKAKGLGRKCPFFREAVASKEVSSFLDSLPRGHQYVFDAAPNSLKDEQGREYEGGRLFAPTISRVSNYGGYLDEEGNHHIDWSSPKVGTHYGVNLLLGNREGYPHPLQSTPKSVVDQNGGGSFRAYASFQVLATKWGISPDENGDPANRQFYIVEEGQPLFYSALPPLGTKAETIHHPNYTEIRYTTPTKLEVTRYIYLLPQYKGGPEAVEVQFVSIKNLSYRQRDLKLVFTGMFGSPNPDNQKVDIIYVTVISQNRAYFHEDGSLKALCPDYYPEYFKREIRFVSFKDDYGGADSFSSDMSAFLGKGSYEHPDGVYSLDNSLSLKGPNFFALGKSIGLPPNKEYRCATYVGYCDNLATKGEEHLTLFEKKLDVLLEKAGTPKKALLALEKIKKEQARYASYLQIENAEDKDLKAYINHNLPFQVRYQSFVSRSFAMTQKGYREIGFREIQDLYASIPYLLSQGKQALVKSLLSEWISNVYKMGYANHNFFYIGKEPGMCSDDALWLIDAIYRYISATGDLSFLHKRFKVAGSKSKRELLDTISAILLYSGSISIGKHGLPLLDCADWNDCLKLDPDYLDGPAKEKEYKRQLRKSGATYGAPLENNFSESVMNAFLFVIAAKEAASLCRHSGDKAVEELATRLAQKMERNTLAHAYIEGYFARVLLNRDNPVHTSYVGSKGDKLSIDPNIDGSYYLNSFSWSLLSNVASEAEIKEMLPVLEKLLRCDAGYKLCTPENLGLAGAKSASTDHYFPGDRENEGVFKHATMMAVVAMLRKAKLTADRALAERLIDDADFMLDLVLPYHVLRDVDLYKGNPRFCTQYNNSKTQENIGPMLSGTATWLTLAVEEKLGYVYTEEGLSLVPALGKEDSSISYRSVTPIGSLHIQILKQKGVYCDPSRQVVTLDGEEVAVPISLKKLSGHHEIEVFYR